MTTLNAANRTRAASALEQSQGTPECRKWRQGVFGRFDLLADDLLHGFVAQVTIGGGGLKGNTAGNRWLRLQRDYLLLGGFNVTHDAEALENYAMAQAEGVFRDISREGRKQRRERAQAVRARLWAAPVSPTTTLIGHRFSRVTLPARRDADSAALALALSKAQRHTIDVAAPHDIDQMTSQQRAILLAKLSSAPWWRRRLRVLAQRRMEQFQRRVKKVHRRAGIYVSNLGLEAWRARGRANRAMLDDTTMVNQLGDEFTLGELSDTGMANPDNRRSELMLRIRDTENEARSIGHVATLYTVTTPSRFHPIKAADCRPNEKYDGSTPREAQAHLNSVWAKARAALHRRGICIYGMRVVEPHHDGTPHWHLLLFVRPEDKGEVTDVMRRYAEEESPEETFGKGGVKTTARFDAVSIDYNRGTAAGYVAKYISKNINGKQFIDADLYGHDPVNSAERVAAWASIWGIRQFQFFGLPSVTVWRELRRLRLAGDSEFAAAQHASWIAATKPAPDALTLLEELRAAALNGDWAAFCRANGGVGAKAGERPLQPWSITRLDTKQSEMDRQTGEVSDLTKRGRYGEQIQAVVGVVVTTDKGSAEFLTRFYRWEVAEGRSAGVELGVDLSEAASAAQPWTGMNYCTEPDFSPRKPPPEIEAEQLQRYQKWRKSADVQAEMIDLEFYEEELRASLRKQLNPDPVFDPYNAIPELMLPELEGL